MRRTIFLVAMLLPLAGAQAANLTVTVGNIASSAGRVLVAVCTAETFLEPDCPYHGSAPAVRGETEVRIEGVEPGGYAIQAFHDANDNAAVDTDFLGRPQEGIGFSRDAPIRFGPPEFARARISIGPEDSVVSLQIRYF